MQIQLLYTIDMVQPLVFARFFIFVVALQNDF